MRGTFESYLTSFNGRYGAVVPTNGDYTADQVAETADRLFFSPTAQTKLNSIVPELRQPLANYLATSVPLLGQVCHVTDLLNARGLPLRKIGDGATQWQSLSWEADLLLINSTEVVITSSTGVNVFGTYELPGGMLVNNGDYVCGWASGVLRNGDGRTFSLAFLFGAQALQTILFGGSGPADVATQGRNLQYGVAAFRESNTVLRGTILGGMTGSSASSLASTGLGNTSGSTFLPGSSGQAGVVVADTFWASARALTLTATFGAAGDSDTYLSVLQYRIALNKSASPV